MMPSRRPSLTRANTAVLRWLILRGRTTRHVYPSVSMDGHVGCVHVLAAVNSAAADTGQVSFRLVFLFASHKSPEAELWGRRAA